MQFALGQAVLGSHAAIGGALHAQRVPIYVQQRFLLVPVGSIHPAKGNHLAHGLDIVAHALGLCVHVADVDVDAVALLDQLLDTLYERLQAVGGDWAGLGGHARPAFTRTCGLR